jgi:AraC family transcriptional regulator of adaptative response/methylated-DNA-[protein]-cysteine methyltransferase
MYQAVLNRDSTYDGVFFVAVRTTGIFCRPTCPAKKPNEENVEFFRAVGDALSSGYRPCKRCRPLELNGKAPSWLERLLTELERDPSRRWTDADLRALDIDPTRVRRWFRSNYGMTFHAFQRARRLGLALGQIQDGADVTGTAFDHGYESLSGFRDAFERLFGATPGQSRATTRVVVTRFLTPLGPMVAGATDDGVCLLEFIDRRMFETQIKRLQKHLNCVMTLGSNEHIAQLGDELKRYFEGTLKDFTVSLIIPGTEFQKAVWNNLRQIPYGQTRSYEQLAVAIGKPGAQRAVGRANGDNRIGIVVPCHRVVRSDGSLCGYGGGVWRKRFLLDHESAQSGTGQLSIFGTTAKKGPVPGSEL